MAKDTKEDLINALVKAGYEKKGLKDLSLKKLEELVASEAEEVEGDEDVEENESEDAESEETSDEEESDEEAVDDEDEEEEVASGDEVDIVKGEGENKEYVRTFSKKVHGKDFKDVAKEFCEKHVKCSISKKPVTNLVVRWREYEKKADAQVEKTERFTKKRDALLFAQKDGKVRKVVLVVEKK